MLGFSNPYILAVGFTAVIAGLTSGLAAHISAFAALWTEDLYKAYLRPDKNERHYLTVGRWAVVGAILLSLLTCYLTFLFSDVMEHLQLIFSIFGSPFAAVVLLGMCTRRVVLRGAIARLGAGTVAGLLHLLGFVRGWLHYGSTLNADFHGAIYSFAAALVVALLWGTCPSEQLHRARLTASSVEQHDEKGVGGLLVLSSVLLILCGLLNWVFR